MSPEEQAILLDIVRQYHNDVVSAQTAMAWVYGLVVNSPLNDGTLD